MTAAVGTVYRLDLPYARVPLSLNDRHHWAKKAAITREVRDTVAWLAKAQRIPRCEHVAVTLVYSPTRAIRRDPSNLLGTQKPCLDGLIIAGVVRDDCPEFVTERMPVIDPDRLGALWLLVEVVA